MRKKPTFWAWLAGIIDGEGCLTIAKQIRKNRASPAFRAVLTISNTERCLLEPIFNELGGGIYKRPDARIDKEWADSWTWHCRDSVLSEVLVNVMPYMMGKKKKVAVMVLDFIAHKKSFIRQKGSVLGKKGGSKPLGEEEIAYRELLWNEVRSINSKGRYSRSL